MGPCMLCGKLVQECTCKNFWPSPKPAPDESPTKRMNDMRHIIEEGLMLEIECRRPEDRYESRYRSYSQLYFKDVAEYALELLAENRDLKLQLGEIEV